MARKKVANPLLIQSWDEADNLMKALSAHQREVSRIEADRQAKIDALTYAAAQEAKAHQDALVEGEKQLCLFAELHKADFDKVKSRDMNYGTLGYRKSTTLKLLYPITTVIENLKKRGMLDCIREKAADVDKQKLRQQPETAITEVGGKLISKDVFYVEYNAEPLPVLETEG